jgi:hypothetical protein
MKVGDLIKFKGSWGPTVVPGERRTGIVMKVWTNGRTRRIQSIDVLWDNGHIGNTLTKGLEVVINASR